MGYKQPRSTRSLIVARRQLMKDLGERCLDVANRRGINVFEMLLHYVIGDEKALGYEGKRIRYLKDGGFVEENWITPEMRFAATKEALKYVAPQLSAVAVTELGSMAEDGEEGDETRPATREDIIKAIKDDPFFQIQKHEIIDVTPSKDPFQEETNAAGPPNTSKGAD